VGRGRDLAEGEERRGEEEGGEVGKVDPAERITRERMMIRVKEIRTFEKHE
jgi:hypothetical protein